MVRCSRASVAFDLGFERAGFRTLWQVENDPYCHAILAQHFPTAQRFGDIRTAKQLQTPTVISGGFPCQPFSVAGKRRGSDDNRYLWPEMFRVIQLTKPSWVIAENVRGLVTCNEGMVLEQVCADLESEGYEVQPFIIPNQHTL